MKWESHKIQISTAFNILYKQIKDLKRIFPSNFKFTFSQKFFQRYFPLRKTFLVLKFVKKYTAEFSSLEKKISFSNLIFFHLCAAVVNSFLEKKVYESQNTENNILGKITAKKIIFFWIQTKNRFKINNETRKKRFSNKFLLKILHFLLVVLLA